MCGHTRDPIIYSKFHRNPFRGFGAPGGQNLAFPITLASRFYNCLYYRTCRDTLPRQISHLSVYTVAHVGRKTAKAAIFTKSLSLWAGVPTPFSDQDQNQHQRVNILVYVPSEISPSSVYIVAHSGPKTTEKPRFLPNFHVSSTVHYGSTLSC